MDRVLRIQLDEPGEGSAEALVRLDPREELDNTGDDLFTVEPTLRRNSSLTPHRHSSVVVACHCTDRVLESCVVTLIGRQAAAELFQGARLPAAIVQSDGQAGGQVVKIDGTPLAYNSKDIYLNPFFFVIGDPATDWLSPFRESNDQHNSQN